MVDTEPSGGFGCSGAQSSAAAPSSWAWVHVVDRSSDQGVGWSFVITSDMLKPVGAPSVYGWSSLGQPVQSVVE